MDEISRARLERGSKVATEDVVTVPLCASADGEYSAAYVSAMPGEFHRRQELDVVVYLVSGRLRITDDETRVPMDVVPGEAAFLPLASSAIWQLHEAAHMLVVTRRPSLSRTALAS